MGNFLLSPDSVRELRVKLETARVEVSQFTQPVNQQVQWGNQVFHVAADSDIAAMVDQFVELGPSDRTIGPCHAVKKDVPDV